MTNTKRFAVKGTSLELMKFEDELLRLGFTNQHDTNVFDFRSFDGKPAKYIAINCHIYCETPLSFTPAANPGIAEAYDGILYLSESFNTALNYAKLNADIVALPKLITEDGKKLFIGDRFFFIKKDFRKGSWARITNIGFKLFDGLLAFSTEEAADNYINMNKKIFNKKDIQDAIKASLTKYTLTTDGRNTFPVIDSVELASRLSLFE